MLDQSLVVLTLDYCNSLQAGLDLLSSTNPECSCMMCSQPPQVLPHVPIAKLTPLDSCSCPYQILNTDAWLQSQAPTYLKAHNTPCFAPWFLGSSSSARLDPPCIKVLLYPGTYSMWCNEPLAILEWRPRTYIFTEYLDEHFVILKKSIPLKSIPSHSIPSQSTPSHFIPLRLIPFIWLTYRLLASKIV